ncbi:hypothetical protein Q8F55_008571 [Vanrija albida]|uniref:Zn(2)-C6 fungal-type domain-containing protein n=1 Tax=Vanrija albida TaxID=181172 RepID=A0ABR3PRB7_9TREE
MLTPDPTPARKRRKHTRKATGCRECRRQHVRCAEGAVLASGRRAACKRCWQLDQACAYPANGRVRKGQLAAATWEAAQAVDVWVGAGAEGSPGAGTGAGRTELAPEAVIELPLPEGAVAVTAPIAPTLDAWLSTELWRSVLTPSPAKPLSTFTLAALHTAPLDRQVVSYFETQGCNEIVAVSTYKHNWIFSQLFPRLFGILLAAPVEDSVDSSIRDWLRNSLLHLAYIHRGNVEHDEPKSWYWRSEGTKHRQLASYALLKAKVHSPADEWKTEEYLIGFFVRCMADMLSSGRLELDEENVFELPPGRGSPIYPTLHNLLAYYSIAQFACSPLPRDAFAMPAPVLAFRAAGSEWAERFLGASQGTVNVAARAATLVARRRLLLRRGEDTAAAGLILRAEIEQLANSLGGARDWDEGALDLGRSDRVQRGSEVLRQGVRTMLLCEGLDVDLDDPRLVACRDKGVELVADCDPSSTPGFQLALTIMAVYCIDLGARQRIRDLIKVMLCMSFGPNYRGTDEMLALCWEIVDKSPTRRYKDGIAPWREAMNALGRNLWL